jgi:hypothetical protein
MKADLTRNTFHPLKHFTRVLMQQGRVQLDSDWNEQAAILLRYLQTLGADLIGPAGGPDDKAFSIIPLNVEGDFGIGLGRYYVDGILCEAEAEAIPITPTNNTHEIVTPQWTLDGRALDHDQIVEIFDDVAQPFAQPGFASTLATITKATPSGRKLTFSPVAAVDLTKGTNPSMRRVLTYLTQPDLPNADALAQTLGNAAAAYLVYLDVWERHITWIEDASIQEVALGGPDTATRAKIVWQVKVVKGKVSEQNKDKPCDGFTPDDQTLLPDLFGPYHGRLKARAKQKSTPVDPCIIPPDANYHGEENQLYRVEVHKAGLAASTGPSISNRPSNIRGPKASQTDGATFKWSRENGSVTFPIVAISSGDNVTTLTLANLGRDDRFGLNEGNWVEIQDDDYVLRNQAGTLLQVQSIDRSRLQVTLAGTADAGIGADPAKHPLLRRWDHQQGDPAEGGLTLGPDNAALILENDGNMWLELENGVQIQFQPAPAGQQNEYRTGDYWLIPARTATADVEWPTESVTDNQGNTTVTPLSKPPDGIVHHYAPLGAFTVNGEGNIKLISDKNASCRKQFTVLTSK